MRIDRNKLRHVCDFFVDKNTKMIFVMCYPMVTAKAKIGVFKMSAIEITDEPNSQNIMYYGKSSKKRQLMTG